MEHALLGAGHQGWTPRKNGQNGLAVAVAGQNKGHTLKSFQVRKPILEQYDNTEQ